MNTKLGDFLDKKRINKSKLATSIGMTTDRLNALCHEDEAILYAEEFYAIITATKSDLNSVAEEFFGDRNPPDLRELNKSKNKTNFGQYISKYLYKQKDLADALKINKTRFNNLIQNKVKGPYAYEVYDLAKGFGEDIEDTFKRICESAE